MVHSATLGALLHALAHALLTCLHRGGDLVEPFDDIADRMQPRHVRPHPRIDDDVRQRLADAPLKNGLFEIE